jgi:hypothetical protein
MQTKLAELAFNLICTAPTKGADAEAVTAVKQWLKQIGSGQLVVAPPKKPKVKAA